MHNLALALHLNGHNVSGSDDEIYEPAKSRLARYNLLPEAPGWFPQKINRDIELVILGMHAREDNPEIKVAKELGLQIMSFPEYIFHHSKNKQRIVIAGSHGKTTLTSMIMHALKEQDFKFDYLVGAQLEGFETMVSLSDAPIMVIEGDEYLSSPMDRRPKFMHYHPHILLITGIAWDHMNVFPTKENYNSQFTTLLNSLSINTKVVYYSEDNLLSEMVRSSVNTNNSIAYKSLNYNQIDDIIKVDFEGQKYEMNIFGRHNFENMNGARIVCNLLGMENHLFLQSMANFKGAAKRLEYIVKNDDIIAIKDFAHAPSKVRATTNAVAETFKGKKIIAILELHTFSSLNIEFHSEFADTLKEAHAGLVYYSDHTLKMKKLTHFSPNELKESFKSSNVQVFNKIEELWQAVDHYKSKDNVYLFMSSGTFDGTDLLKKSLELSEL